MHKPGQVVVSLVVATARACDFVVEGCELQVAVATCCRVLVPKVGEQVSKTGEQFGADAAR
jgi:hypothetical protein